jgi:SAM-dependent methyltransferase
MTDLSANVERFTGFADVYDRHRPKPPPLLRELLPRLAGVDRPKHVVDLGCGTGLSTLYWFGFADEIIGVDPTGDMRSQAEAAASAVAADTVRIVAGFSTETGLPNGCADLVTCSQSLHWMDPEPTFAEVARILRPGGVFAAYDCDWPPTCDWEAEHAFLEVMHRAFELGDESGAYEGVRRWEKAGHLERMKASGRFRHCKELLLHSQETGNAERLVGLSISQGSVATLLKRGVSEGEIGLDRLRETAQRVLGKAPQAWHWSYRLHCGLR